MKFLPNKINNRKLAFVAAGLLSAFGAPAAHAQITTVFYILLENRNWYNGTDTGAPAQIEGSAAAPYLNSLVTPNNPNAAQVSFCSAYHNALAFPGYNGTSGPNNTPTARAFTLPNPTTSGWNAARI